MAHSKRISIKAGAGKKIAVFSGTRAEYGLLYWLMKDVHDDPDLHLQCKRSIGVQTTPYCLNPTLKNHLQMLFSRSLALTRSLPKPGANLHVAAHPLSKYRD